MTTDDNNTKLLETYQKALELLLEHAKVCPSLERKMIKEFDSENE